MGNPKISVRQVRVLLGTSSGLVSTLVAALSHVIAGGISPSVFAVVVAVTGSSISGIAIVGRRLSLLRLVAIVFTSQLLYHALFSAVPQTSTTPDTVVAEHHSAFVPMSGVAVAGIHDTHFTVSMMIWHLVAAIFTVLAVRRGQLALSAIVRVGSVAVNRVLTLWEPQATQPTAPERLIPFLPVLSPIFQTLSAAGVRGPPRVID